MQTPNLLPLALLLLLLLMALPDAVVLVQKTLLLQAEGLQHTSPGMQLLGGMQRLLHGVLLLLPFDNLTMGAMPLQLSQVHPTKALRLPVERLWAC